MLNNKSKSIKKMVSNVLNKTILSERYESNKCRARFQLKKKVISLLKKGQSLYITGEAGSGKSDLCEAIAQDLRSEKLPVSTLSPGTAKEILLGVCEDLGVDPNDEKDKPLSVPAMRNELTELLKLRSCFLICDNLPQIPVGIRLWLDKLYTFGQPILGTGKNKPEKDIIFKLVNLDLEPLKDDEIVELMNDTAHSLGIKINAKELAQRASGNPGVAVKLVKESNLELEGINIKSPEPQHQRWFALDKWVVLLIAGLALFRYAGRDPLLVLGGSAMVLSRVSSQLVRYTPKKC